MRSMIPQAAGARRTVAGPARARGTGPTPRKSLFVCYGACQSGKDNLRKVVERFGHESFDFLFLVWDGSRYDEPCFAGCTIVQDDSALFCRLKRQATPDLARRYEYVFPWVEDIDILDFDPQNFLRILRAHRIEVAQPSLSPDSVIYHPVTAHQDGLPGRYTDFAEEMVFVFRGDLWERFWDLIALEGNPWGWGYDEVTYSVGRFRRMAVIDAEMVKHLRKGSYHPEAFAARDRVRRRYRRWFFPRKRSLCPISDAFRHKYLTTPLRLNLHFLYARLYLLLGIAYVRSFLRTCLRARLTSLPGTSE